MKIDRRTDALIVVDLQPDFMPGGALPVPEGDAVARPIAAILDRFDTVVATQDWHPRGHISFASTHGKPPYSTIPLYGGEQVLWPDHCIPGTPGAELHGDLPREPLTLILRKGNRRDVDSYSAFRENVGPGGTRETTGLGAWLRARGIKRVFLCGLARDYCVRWSAEDAAAEGFEAVVLDDLTRPVDPARRAETDAAFDRARVRRMRSADLRPAEP
jgi:nicotinamidase/pyrazinamidase